MQQRVRWIGWRGARRAALALVAGCSRHSAPAGAAAVAAHPQVAPQPKLTQLAIGKLADAYAGGTADADALYRGKRYAVVGNVVSVQSDAGAGRVVLGSKLQPVVATGLDPNAAATLVTDTPIEADCMVTGAIGEIPNLDCGPNGLPRPVSPPP